jgi:hypothetical protein
VKRVLIGCLALLALLAVAGVAGVLWILREGPQLASRVEVPAQVAAGESFTLSLVVSNPHPDPVTLDSVDVDESLLAGFQVLAVEPEPTHTDAIPFLEQRTWSFGRELPAAGELEVRFELRAVEAGRFSGNVEVCNPEQDCPGQFVDLVVTPAAPAEIP